MYLFAVSSNDNTFLNNFSKQSCIFHSTCWCVLSIMRYVYIVHKDWLEAKFPENKKLIAFTLGHVWMIFFFILSAVGLTFRATVAPYGWPRKSYSESVPEDQRSIFFGVVVVMYILPVSTRVAMYSLLYYKVRVKMSQVGLVTLRPARIEAEMDFGGIYLGQSTPDSLNIQTPNWSLNF
jgi:hypothetical protein